MGSTPRKHKYQVPMFTRSTDVSMTAQCPGRWALTLFYEDQQAEASFFVLGDLLHRGIEYAITDDVDLAYMATTWADIQFHDPGGISEMMSTNMNRRIESSQRGFDTLFDDYQRMIANWFKFVHPDSEKRHPIYDNYEWPPVVERKFYRPPESAGTSYGVWGSIDADFTAKDQSHRRFVDWKSGTQKQRDSNQLHFYIFGAGVDTDTTQGHYHHLDRVRKPSIVQEMDPYPGDHVIQDWIIQTEESKEALTLGYMPHLQPDWYCNYCPVQEFCPEEGWPSKRKNRQALKRMVHLSRPLEKPIGMEEK